MVVVVVSRALEVHVRRAAAEHAPGRGTREKTNRRRGRRADRLGRDELRRRRSGGLVLRLRRRSHLPVRAQRRRLSLALRRLTSRLGRRRRSFAADGRRGGRREPARRITFSERDIRAVEPERERADRCATRPAAKQTRRARPRPPRRRHPPRSQPGRLLPLLGGEDPRGAIRRGELAEPGAAAAGR